MINETWQIDPDYLCQYVAYHLHFRPSQGIMTALNLAKIKVDLQQDRGKVFHIFAP